MISSSLGQFNEVCRDDKGLHVHEGAHFIYSRFVLSPLASAGSFDVSELPDFVDSMTMSLVSPPPFDVTDKQICWPWIKTRLQSFFFFCQTYRVQIFVDELFAFTMLLAATSFGVCGCRGIL